MLGIAVVPALAIAFVIAGLVGARCGGSGPQPLRAAGALIVAIASIALNLVLENVVRFVFGNDMRGYDLPIDARLALRRAAHRAAAAAEPWPRRRDHGGGVLFLFFTRFGKAMRAVADNPDLARLKGIDPARIADRHGLARRGTVPASAAC